MPNDGNETFDMEHLLDLAKEKKYRLLKEELVELNEVDIASFIEELDSERTVIVFRMLPKRWRPKCLPSFRWTSRVTLSTASLIKSFPRSWKSFMWMMP